MPKPCFTVARSIFDEWKEDLQSGKPPIRYRTANSGPVASFELRPKQISIIGGSPGMGKTALAMQMIIDAIRLDANLRAAVLNVEIPAQMLLERQLARLSGVDLTTIRDRKIEDDEWERIDSGLATIESFADRLCFVNPPFTLQNATNAVSGFKAHILVVDYLQRITI